MLNKQLEGPLKLNIDIETELSTASLSLELVLLDWPRASVCVMLCQSFNLKHTLVLPSSLHSYIKYSKKNNNMSSLSKC